MTTKQMQLLLMFLGYGDDFDVTKLGMAGRKTQTALSKFSADYGVGKDGLIDAVAGKIQKKSATAYMPTYPGIPHFWVDIKHFSREEFRCKCGGKYCTGFPAEPEEKLVRIADAVRDHFGKPVSVSSGVRCQLHNAAVGGVSNSRHLSGKAVDFCINGFSSQTILDYVQKQSGVRYAYAIDSNYVHMDIE